MLYSPEYHHRVAHVPKLRAKLMFAFGFFSLISVGCTYALGVITLVLIAVGGIYLWCGREYFRLQVLREANELKLLSGFTEYEAAFLKASPNPSDEPMMIVCSWDEFAGGNSLVRLVLMKRSDEDFVLVGIGFAPGGGSKIVVDAVPLDVDTAVHLFSVSQRDKASKQNKSGQASSDSGASGSGGSEGGAFGGDGGSCGDGGCGGGGD